MPTCSEGYRTKKVDDIMGNQSILDIALQLHMHCTGASDPLPTQTLLDYIHCLLFYLDNWVDMNDHNSYFDSAVKLVLHAAKSDLIRENIL